MALRWFTQTSLWGFISQIISLGGCSRRHNSGKIHEKGAHTIRAKIIETPGTGAASYSNRNHAKGEREIQASELEDAC